MFRRFARACLKRTGPLTADGKAGKFANDPGFALPESKKQVIPLPFRGQEL